MFTDPVSGKSYLYWGNSDMAGEELNDDMVSLNKKTLKTRSPERENVPRTPFALSPGGEGMTHSRFELSPCGESMPDAWFSLSPCGESLPDARLGFSPDGGAFFVL